MVYIRFGNVRVEILAFDESQEKLVHDLNMWPSDFENRFVFLGVKSFALWIHRWWNRSEQILGEHLNHSRVHLLCNDLAIVGDIIEQFV
jgi:hypothetical protein